MDRRSFFKWFGVGVGAAPAVAKSLAAAPLTRPVPSPPPPMIAATFVHPPPGLGDLMPSSFVVPQNPIRLSGMARAYHLAYDDGTCACSKCRQGADARGVQ